MVNAPVALYWAVLGLGWLWWGIAPRPFGERIWQRCPSVADWEIWLKHVFAVELHGNTVWGSAVFALLTMSVSVGQTIKPNQAETSHETSHSDRGPACPQALGDNILTQWRQEVFMASSAGAGEGPQPRKAWSLGGRPGGRGVSGLQESPAAGSDQWGSIGCSPLFFHAAAQPGGLQGQASCAQRPSPPPPEPAPGSHR